MAYQVDIEEVVLPVCDVAVMDALDDGAVGVVFLQFDVGSPPEFVGIWSAVKHVLERGVVRGVGNCGPALVVLGFD